MLKYATTLEETEQMLKEIFEDFPKLFGVPKELMNLSNDLISLLFG